MRAHDPLWVGERQVNKEFFQCTRTRWETGLRFREHGEGTSFSLETLGRLYNDRELEDFLRLLLYIREGGAKMESGDLWVGGQSKHLKGRAEGFPLLTVLVPDGALTGFSSLRTFLFITLEARVRFWVVPVLKDI